MSFGNSRLPPHHYTGQPQTFVPWSQQANQMFNFANQLTSIPPVSPPVFSPNLLIQQQNNYFNSTLPSSSLYLPNAHYQMLSHHFNPYVPWLPRPMPVKNSNIYGQKAKNNPEVICLDDDIAGNVVVIEDSIEQLSAPVVSKKDEKLKNEIHQGQLKLQFDRQIKQKDFSCEAKKNQNDLPQKRLNRNAKYCTVTEINKKQTDTKLQKKKMITKDRFVYKFTPHEKHLSELSEYRQYFPHQTVTGPQFQAKLPHLRLFGNTFGGHMEKSSWLGLRREKLLSRLQVK